MIPTIPMYPVEDYYPTIEDELPLIREYYLIDKGTGLEDFTEGIERLAYAIEHNYIDGRIYIAAFHRYLYESSTYQGKGTLLEKCGCAYGQITQLVDESKALLVERYVYHRLRELYPRFSDESHGSTPLEERVSVVTPYDKQQAQTLHDVLEALQPYL